MATFRQSLAWMHTWTGLLLGSVLYFMFLTGAAAYYDTEIDRWMRPEHPRPVEVSDPVKAFEKGVAYAHNVAPDADYWFIRIPLSRSYSPFVEVSWEGANAAGEPGSGRAELDLRTGEPVPVARETGGGQALYLLHYTFHYMPKSWGQWLAGMAGLFMFGAILSGIVIHKKIFRDFFTFRPGSGSRAWLDGHNVLSVMTLPYQIMIAFSGLVTLALFYFPLIVAAHFGSGVEGENQFYDALYPSWPQYERAGVPRDLVPIAQVLERAQQIAPDERFPMIGVSNPGDENAVIEVMGEIGASVVRGFPQIFFDGVTGEVIDVMPRPATGSLATGAVIEGLHEALFAGPMLRFILFFSALAGAGMVATGLVLWAKKRLERAARGTQFAAGLALVERLNVGAIAGLPIAIAAYFWANRLLPTGMADRADWEMNALFVVWGLALGHSALRMPRRAWAEQFGLAAAMFLLLPALNTATTNIHLGRTLPLFGRTADWALAGIDLGLLGIGAVFAICARKAARKIRPRPPLRPTMWAQPAE